MQLWRDRAELFRLRSTRLPAEAKVLELARRWAPELNDPPGGASFFRDVFDWSTTAIRDIRRDESFDHRNSEVLMELYSAAARSYARLGAAGRAGRQRTITHSNLTGRWIHYDIPQHALDILRTAWWESVALGAPNVRSGIQLERLLYEGRTTSYRGELFRSERVRILQSALDAPGRFYMGAVILRIMQVQEMEEAYKVRAQSLARMILDDGDSGLNVALAAHALSIGTHSPDEKEQLLRAACENYRLSITDSDSWLDWNGTWRLALRELRGLNPAAAEAAQKYRERAMREFP
jgi:hypothetical protein